MHQIFHFFHRRFKPLVLKWVSFFFYFLDQPLQRVEGKWVSFFISLINLLRERNENGSAFFISFIVFLSQWN